MMKKYGLILISIFLLTSCYHRTFSSFPDRSNPNTHAIIEGNKSKFLEKISLANNIFSNSQSNIKFDGSFNEIISDDKILKDEGNFEILIKYGSNNDILAASFNQHYYNPSKMQYHELECYISGPVLYKHTKEYNNQTVLIDEKKAEVITKNNISFLKDYLIFVPFNSYDFKAIKETYTAINESIYCLQLEIDVSSIVNQDLRMYYDIQFEFINGFYSKINYSKYYNSTSFSTYFVEMNIHFSNDEIVFPSNLDEYNFKWENKKFTSS